MANPTGAQPLVRIPEELGASIGNYKRLEVIGGGKLTGASRGHERSHVHPYDAAVIDDGHRRR